MPRKRIHERATNANNTEISLNRDEFASRPSTEPLNLQAAGDPGVGLDGLAASKPRPAFAIGMEARRGRDSACRGSVRSTTARPEGIARQTGPDFGRASAAAPVVRSVRMAVASAGDVGD